MALLRGSLSSRVDVALPDVANELVDVALSDVVGAVGAIAVLFVSNENGAPITVTLPGVPDPFGRSGPVVETVPDGKMAFFVLGSAATLGRPVVVDFSAISGVKAGAWILSSDPRFGSGYALTPGFWDVPDASFSESFAAGAPPLWEGVEFVPEPFDFSAPGSSFSESFAAGAPPLWEGVEFIPEPFDFSAPDSSQTETFNDDWT